MPYFNPYLLEMKDGTVKQINPFTETEVWAVPGRGNRPLNRRKKNLIKIDNKKIKEEEDFCQFCTKNYFKTPPEKGRVILNNDRFETKCYQKFSDLDKDYAYFRRVANLWEIVSYFYWAQNYNYKIPQKIINWKNQYIEEPEGKQHILDVINFKLRQDGIPIDTLSEEEKLDKLSRPLFSGCHDLIIGGRHYSDGADYSYQLNSAGEFTQDEHFQFIKFTVESMKEIYENNRFVRYVSVFQNWLEQAGASIEHLHKQLVGLDEWGTLISKEIQQIRRNRNIYNEYAANLAGYYDLIFLENDYAIAFADIGHRYPTIGIYSKCVHPRPQDHTDEEIKGVSDLVHAIHCATGQEVSTNEEWFYSPPDAVEVMPWHILIKWRVINPAGFEGGTRIYINPVSPQQVRDMLVPRLYEIREQGKIKNVRIAEECQIVSNPLKYYKYNNGYSFNICYLKNSYL